MKVTILGSGSSGGVPLIGNYWGNCNPSNLKNNRTRVSVLVSYSRKNILIDLKNNQISSGLRTEVRFRHAGIKLHRSEVSKLYDLFYALMRPFYPLMKLFPTITTSSKLGLAMINSFYYPLSDKFLDNRKINNLSQLHLNK